MSIKIVEKPNPFPASNAFSFLDRLDALLRAPSHAPSTATPGLTTGIDFSFTDRLDSLLQATSRAPSEAASQFPTSTPTDSPVSNIATASDMPSSSPSKLPSDFPSSNPLESMPTVLFVKSIPPSAESSRGGAVLLPTPFPREYSSVSPTGMNSAVLPLIETESLAPSGRPSGISTISPTVGSSTILKQPVSDSPSLPADDVVSSSAPSIAAEAAVEDATDDNLGYQDSFDFPESLYEKITGDLQVNNVEATENVAAESDQTTTTSSNALAP